MIYLDYAATSYRKPERVYDAMLAFAKERGANPGRALYRMAAEAGDAYEDSRRTLARFFGAKDPRRMVFTMNATDGANMALKGILHKGGHVISSTFEHTCILRPLNRLAADGRIELTRIPPEADGRLSPKRLEEAMRPDTRLVAVTHASNVVGIVQPIEDIAALCRRRGVLLLADCAQTAGVLPIDVEAMGLDVMVTTGHKSLFGPPGTGALYVREGVEMRAWREGGSGDSREFHPEDYPAHLEGGTMNTWGAIGLAEGVRFLEETGLPNIHKKEAAFVEQAFDALEGDPRFFLYGPRRVPRTGVVTLNLRGVEPAVAGSILDERWGVCVRTGRHCAPGAHALFGQDKGGLRLSPGWFTTEAEMATALSALREIADEMVPAAARAASS